MVFTISTTLAKDNNEGFDEEEDDLGFFVL